MGLIEDIMKLGQGSPAMGSTVDLMPPSDKDVDPWPTTVSAMDETKETDNAPLRDPASIEYIANILATFAAASSRIHALRLQDATRWSAQTVTLPAGVNNSVRLAGSDRMRKTMNIKNMGEQPLFVSPVEGVASKGTAYVLDATESVTLNNTGEVFVGTEAAWVEGDVSFLQERYE